MKPLPNLALRDSILSSVQETEHKLQEAIALKNYAEEKYGARQDAEALAILQQCRDNINCLRNVRDSDLAIAKYCGTSFAFLVCFYHLCTIPYFLELPCLVLEVMSDCKGH